MSDGWQPVLLWSIIAAGAVAGAWRGWTLDSRTVDRPGRVVTVHDDVGPFVRLVQAVLMGCAVGAPAGMAVALLVAIFLPS